MKKVLIILLFAPVFLFSQSGMGIRGSFGYSGGTYGGASLSYQKLYDYEFGLGWNTNGFGVTGLKLFELVEASAVSLYTGVGIGAATPYDFEFVQVAAVGTIGMGVLLGPIQFSLDWRPEYEFVHQDENPWRFNFGFAVRFMFPYKE